MLCDRLVEMLASPAVDAMQRSAGGRGMRGLSEIVIGKIRVAQRFVLSPLTVTTVNELAVPRAVERTRDHLFFPADITWIEWAGTVPWFSRETRLGCIFVSRTPGIPTLGNIALFLPPSTPGNVEYIPLAGMVDLVGSGPLVRWMIPDAPTAATIDARLFGAWVGAALALINTPRLANVVQHDNRGINAARFKRGRPPLLSWHEVGITIGRGELDRGEPGNSQQIGQTGERSFHHVRTHLRLRRGRVELVRPHWRGNPEIGIVRHKYVVTRSEDKSGPWKGGILPADHALGTEPGDMP